jgi:hypothetical protein
MDPFLNPGIAISILIGSILIAGIPYIVARARNHPQTLPISLLGFCSLLGLLLPPPLDLLVFLLLWVPSLIWACVAISRPVVHQPKYVRPPDEVEQWSRSKDGPGQYRVVGLTAGGELTSVAVKASGRAAAKAIAEKAGISVESLEFVG